MIRNSIRIWCRLLLVILWPLMAQAQPIAFSHQHGFYDEPFTLTIQHDEGLEVRYTLDASEPTAYSRLYSKPLSVNGNTIIRAVGIQDGVPVTEVLTATYLFVDDVLSQSNTPEGYPDTWGSYTQIWGTAIADYEMDPEMTNDPTLREKIAEGLKSLPVLSIVTDKGNLFSHENDSVRGGIYIFTGPPVGDATGHGWTRPASVELFGANGSDGSDRTYDLSVTCGLRLHGGHGRLAEKNPKHSFRLVFKEQYGAKTLNYPLFGEDEPSKFNQLVLRCHFGNSWQHWGESNRTKAQYTRDVWARRIQRKMGRTAVNALYVNVFLNGMYWGMYNLAERVDDQYGKDHLGGKKSDIDVIKIEEDGGNHIEASEGTVDAWYEMTDVAARAADEEAYARLDTLLDIDNFIDYMIINQYGGNTDWDHHNWYAVRRRGEDSQGFRFLCWDSEIILESPNENVLSKNNGMRFPTGIFQNLLQNPQFAKRYVHRAKELLSEEGILGHESVVEVWDSLYDNIHAALYAEAARWGDYRRDVHQWQSAGQLYTVDEHYMAERNRLLNQYFPYRSETVLNSILSYVSVDDFEIPDDWTKLTASMWRQWNGTGADAVPVNDNVNAEMNLNMSVGGGGVVAGFSSVSYDLYADLSAYDKLIIRGTGSRLRILANRLTNHGPYKMIVVSLNSSDPYWDAELGAVALPLADLQTTLTNEGVRRDDAFVHLNAIKVDSGNSANVSGFYLTAKGTDGVAPVVAAASRTATYYDLQGRRVAQPVKGLYIVNGKKIVVK